MTEANRRFMLIDEPLPAQIRISVHVPRSGHLPPDHPYFETRIGWQLRNGAALALPPEIDVAGTGGYPEQELIYSALKELHCVPVQAIAAQLNSHNCFATAGVVPSEHDLLTMHEHYVYESIRTAPLRTGDGSRIIYLAAFRYRQGSWGTADPPLRHSIQYERSGVLRWL